MNRFLYLHIGQTKTGSTHLQSLFTASRATLADAGIVYPIYGDDARVIDRRRMVPCGNGREIMVDEESFREALRAAGNRGHVLFSSELMFNLIYETPGIDWLPRAAREHGFTGVRVLGFLRDPLPFVVSEWQQRVKGSQGETRTLDEYVAEAFNGPSRVVLALERLRALEPFVSSTLLRYETAMASTSGLEGVVAEWLRVPDDVLAERPAAVVNRSLTRSEAELQRLLNVELGRSGHLFGFRLTVDAPDVPKDPPRLGRAAAEMAAGRLSSDVVRINGLLSTEHALRIGMEEMPPPADAADQYTFSSQQLAVLANGVAEHVRSIERANTLAARAKRRTQGIARRGGRLQRRIVSLVAPRDGMGP